MAGKSRGDDGKSCEQGHAFWKMPDHEAFIEMPRGTKKLISRGREGCPAGCMILALSRRRFLEIATVIGDKPTITTWINGVKISEWTETEARHPARGRIALQSPEPRPGVMGIAKGGLSIPAAHRR